MGNNTRKGLVRTDKSYRMTNLPTLRSNSFEFKGKSGQRVVGYTGSVIKRPVKNSLNIYEHFGLVYGHCEDGEFRIIELNINGVECITLRDFLRGSSTYIIEPNIDLSSCGEILTRARQRAFDVYNSRCNNCETFVNYCLGREQGSEQSKNTETMANVILSSLEIYLSMEPSLNGFFKNFDTLRRQIKLDRPEPIQKAFYEQLELLTPQTVRMLSLRLEGVTENQSRGKLYFRVAGKNFAALDERNNRANLKLTPNSRFTQTHSAVRASPGKRGADGWVVAELHGLKRSAFEKLLTDAYHYRLSQQATSPPNFPTSL